MGVVIDKSMSIAKLFVENDLATDCRIVCIHLVGFSAITTYIKNMMCRYITPTRAREGLLQNTLIE